MKVIKTVIIDDEPAVVSIIKYFVKKENLPLDIVGTANRGDEEIFCLQHPQFQL